jgi:hypothetical protein
MLTKGELIALIKDTLTPLKLYSDRVLPLLLGTCAIESSMGTYRRQLGKGPARGIFQMEPSTFEWLKQRYSERYPVIAGFEFSDHEDHDDQAVIMARLKYLSIPAPLPEADDLQRQAMYWRKWYNGNSPRGRSAQDYVECYRVYIGDLG